MYPFKKKIIGDVGYNDYPFPFEDSKNGKPRFMKTFEVLIETRVNEILNFFETREECQQYVIENELRMYLTDESFYKADALTARNYGIHLNRQNTFTFTKKEDIIKFLKPKKMKFDNVIQNPPYDGTLHLDFEELGINMMTDKGRMVIVQPAMLYTDAFNPSSTYVTGEKNNKGPALKAQNSKYAKRVVIDNLNKDFGTSIDTPFAITTFDFDDTKSGEQIEFVCFGVKKLVNSLNDCNLIGDYELTNGIIKKCINYDDTMENHVFKKKMNRDGLHFLRYWNYQLYALGSNYGGVVNQYRNKTIAVYRNLPYGNYFSSYVDSLFYKDVCDSVPIGRKNECDCLYGTKEELENWKYNAQNVKVLMFASLCVTMDKNNNAKKVVPFLCKKKYTNEEANELLGITEREAKFIDYVLEKFEYDSPWFRRYICGPEAATDDEVKEFIDKLGMKYA